MPHYFGQKGHNKQTRQFRKTHPQLRVVQKEVKAQMNFFDQIQEALEKHQSPEGTPLPSTSQEQQKTTTSLEQLITLQPRTKNSKGHFHAQLSKDCDGTATRPPNRGHISIPGGNLEHDRLHESCMVGENPERSQPPADRRFGEAAPYQPDQSCCSNL